MNFVVRRVRSARPSTRLALVALLVFAGAIFIVGDVRQPSEGASVQAQAVTIYDQEAGLEPTLCLELFSATGANPLPALGFSPDDSAPVRLSSLLSPGGFTCHEDVLRGRISAIYTEFRDADGRVAVTWLVPGDSSETQLWSEYLAGLYESDDYDVVTLDGALVAIRTDVDPAVQAAAVDETGSRRSLWETFSERSAQAGD